jgi:hypothetical protein
MIVAEGGGDAKSQVKLQVEHTPYFYKIVRTRMKTKELIFALLRQSEERARAWVVYLQRPQRLYRRDCNEQTWVCYNILVNILFINLGVFERARRSNGRPNWARS